MRIAAISPLSREFGSNFLIVLLLGFGLGTTALLYTALDRLLLHPIPVPHADRLVRVGERHPPVTSWGWFPYSLYKDMHTMRSLDALAVDGEVDTTAIVNDHPQPVVGSMVSGSYFSILGTNAELGRVLTDADDTATTSVPVVLNHRFWIQAFGGSTAVVGSTLRLHDKTFTIVGVMPKQFFGTKIDQSPDFWVPLAAQALLADKPLTDPKADQRFSITGRLREGATASQAQAEFTGIFEASKEIGDKEGQGLIVPIAEGSFALREQFGRALNLLLWGLAALLAMVCASIAGILIARAARRERETAVRMALGASHARLAATMFRESAVLGIVGACGGIALAYAGAPLLQSLLPAGRTPLQITLTPGVPTAALVAVVALAVSIVFGTIPAWLSTRIAPQLALRGGTATRRAGRLSRFLIVFETGAALVLLTGTGLLLHTFDRLRHTDPGFDVEHLVTFSLDLPTGTAASSSSQLPEQLTERVQQLPGVRGAGFSVGRVMNRYGMKTSAAVPGEKIVTFLNTSMDNVSSGYFQALGIPLLAGRSLNAADLKRSSPTPVMVNEAFARQFFPGENPLGKTFGTGRRGDVAKPQNIVVGVVGDSKYRSLRESLLPIFYTQTNDYGSEIWLYVRTSGQPDGIIRSVREQLYALAPQVPFTSVQTMTELVHESLWQERLLVVLAALYSAVSVLLAGLGLYGLLAYDANQRTREFGVRAALGAQRGEMARLMLRDAVRILLPGVVLGGAGCVLLARVIAPTLYGIGPYDPISWGGALLAVAAIGALAVWSPAWRAMRADPAVVLREE